MAVSFIASSAWNTSTASSGTANDAGSQAAGDRIFVFASWKDFSITATAAAAGDTRPLTEVTEFADGSVGAGNGVGSMKVGAWYKDWESGDGAVIVTFSSAVNVAGLTMVTLRKSANETWDTPTFATSTIGLNITWFALASSTLTIANNAIVMELAGFRDDSATMTRDSNTALDDDGTPAVTWNGNIVESPATHLTTALGGDMAADLIYRLVTTGGAGVNLQATGTLTASETGSCLWVHQGSTVEEDRAPELDVYPQILSH